MKQYDVKCPICGHVNHSLYPEETDGWMECEKCGSMTKSKQFGNTIRIPVFRMKEHCRPAKAHV